MAVLCLYKGLASMWAELGSSLVFPSSSDHASFYIWYCRSSSRLSGLKVCGHRWWLFLTFEKYLLLIKTKTNKQTNNNNNNNNRFWDWSNVSEVEDWNCFSKGPDFIQFLTPVLTAHSCPAWNSRGSDTFGLPGYCIQMHRHTHSLWGISKNGFFTGLCLSHSAPLGTVLRLSVKGQCSWELEK